MSLQERLNHSVRQFSVNEVPDPKKKRKGSFFEGTPGNRSSGDGVGLVAQRIRARGYEPRCRGFESILAHNRPKRPNKTSILKAFGGNTRDLDSIWEETGQDCNFTRSDFQRVHTVSGDGVWICGDAVRTYKRRRQDFVKASERNRLNETLEDSAKRR
ncbi:hypothetical protein Tco_1426724, partial [Tanacetum coccineum]